MFELYDVPSRNIFKTSKAIIISFSLSFDERASMDSPELAFSSHIFNSMLLGPQQWWDNKVWKLLFDENYDNSPLARLEWEKEGGRPSFIFLCSLRIQKKKRGNEIIELVHWLVEQSKLLDFCWRFWLSFFFLTDERSRHHRDIHDSLIARAHTRERARAALGKTSWKVSLFPLDWAIQHSRLDPEELDSITWFTVKLNLSLSFESVR